jgi:ABC-type polysaccharide/polyol phosphate export permease
MQIWLFASPIACRHAVFRARQLLYALNPMVGVIGLARWSVLSTPWPGWSLAVRRDGWSHAGLQRVALRRSGALLRM